MRCPRVITALFWLMLGSMAQAEALDRARIANISGSERLRLFAYGKVLDTGAAPHSAVLQMKQSMIGQGFYFDPGAKRLIASQAWLAPVLSYDGNINGGVLQDSFSFKGYVFDADPAFRAKAGVVLGPAGGGVARLAWANGRYLEAALRAEAVWSPEHHIGRSTAEVSLCSRNHVKGWTFFDLCQTASMLKRELGSSSSQDTSLSLTQIFQTKAGYHEIAAEVGQTRTGSGHQPSLTLSWGSVWDRAATKISLTEASPVAGETALQSRVAAEVQWLWGEHAVGLGLWHQSFDGGAFLGTPRHDNATGLSLSYQISPSVTAQIGYMRNQSSVDFFDYAQTSVNLRFDALRW
jgi:hypothetical protein